MSGYKHATVTISQEEYRRLHEADKKRRFSEYQKAPIQDNDRNLQFQRVIQQLADRQQDFEATLYSVAENSEQNAWDFFEGMRSENTAVYEYLTSAIETNSNVFDEALSSLSENFFAQLDRDRQNYLNHLQALLMQQESFQNTYFEKELIAQQWLRHCQALVNFIQSNYEHDKLAPNRLSSIFRHLEFSEMNITNGCYESSLQFSQQAYLGLSELHYELEQAVIKWQTSFETTLADGYELLAVIERNHEVNAIGLEGEDLPYRLDVNYWTQGKYERLLDYSRQLADYITGGQTALSTDELSQIATQVFPAIRESLENIVFEARISALNSQIRMNIAETAFRALEKQGFELEDAGYRGGDMRSSFNARLECVDGTEVIVQVLPTDKSVEEISNDLVVMTSHPTMKTEHEARMRWDELRRTLNQYNLIVGKVEADQPASETNSLENSPFQNHNIEQAEG